MAIDNSPGEVMASFLAIVIAKLCCISQFFCNFVCNKNNIAHDATKIYCI